MKRKVILSGALCMCMLSSSAFAANTTSATSTNSSAVSVIDASTGKPTKDTGNETAIVTYESTSSSTTATSSSAPYCIGTKGTIVSMETDGESPMIEVKTETVESLVLQIGSDPFSLTTSLVYSDRCTISKLVMKSMRTPIRLVSVRFRPLRF